MKLNNQFTKGQVLVTRSLCDHNRIFKATVLLVTPKAVTIKMYGKKKRCKIHIMDDGVQFIYPLGKYSMSPIFKGVKDHG